MPCTFLNVVLRAVLIASVALFLGGGDAQAQLRRLSESEVKALTLKAVELIRQEGPEAAFARFNVAGEFKHDEIYVNVIDFDGAWRCYPPHPDWVGRSVLNVKDLDGRYLVQEILAAGIERGEGWVEYKWMNPATKSVQPKRTFVKRVPGKELVAYIGIYD